MLPTFTKWLNDNQGILSLVLFVASLVGGWVSGIFRSLIRKPKFTIRVIDKMTFGVSYFTGGKYTPPGLGTYDLHKTAFAIYLEIVNVGSAPSNLGKVRIGYYQNNLKKSTLFQKRVWITESNILADFSIPLANGQSLSIPHLRQVYIEPDHKYNGFLEVGRSVIGVAYFEQNSSWGSLNPRHISNNMVDIKIEVKDAFGSTYSKKVQVRVIELKDALRYNPSFSFTEALFDQDPIDAQYNTTKAEVGGEVEEEN